MTTDTRIVTSTYRYKRPPRKRKPVLPEVPAIVTKRAPRQQASAPKPPAPANDDRKPRSSPSPRTDLAAVVGGSDIAQSANVGPRSVPAAVAPADAGPRSAIVTVKRRGSRFGDVPDMTLEEHRRRGEAADTLFREIVRQATE